jgi:hypothetical protein
MKEANNYILSIDNPFLKKIKDSLNFALKLAAREASEGAVAKIALNIDITSNSLKKEGDKRIEPINYTCNVKTTKDINKDKDTVQEMGLREKDGNYYPYDEQVTLDEIAAELSHEENFEYFNPIETNEEKQEVED